jgi:hypothetical protein
MADIQDVIKRLRYVYSSEGADKAASDMERVSGAQASITTTSSSAERATMSLDRQFMALERRFNPVIRAQQDFEKVQRQINAAVQQNPALQGRANDVLALATAQFEKNVGATHRATEATHLFGMAGWQWRQTAMQMQDVAVSLAGGMNPLTVAMQQGGQLAGVMNARLLGAVGGFAAVAVAVAATARAYAEFDRYQIKVNAALNLTGGASGMSLGRINGLTSSLAGVGTESVNDIRSAIAELLRFRSVSGDVFERTLRASQDLATTGFFSLSTASQTLGRALSDPVRGLDTLREAGIRVSASTQKMVEDSYRAGETWKAQNAILGTVEAQIGGAAKEVDTFETSYVRAQNTLKQTLENWGGHIAGVIGLKSALDGLSAFLQRFGGPGGAAGNASLATALGKYGKVSPPIDAGEWNGFLQQMLGARDRISGVTLALERQKEVAGNTAVEVQVLEQQWAAGVTPGSAEGRNIADLVYGAEAKRTMLEATQAIRQQTTAVQIEAATVGMAGAEAEKYRLVMTAVADAKARGIRLGAGQVAVLSDEAEAYRRAAQAAAEAKLLSQTRFQSQTALMSSSDQQIAGQLQGVWGDRWREHMNDAVVDQFRVNQSLKDITSEDAKEVRVDHANRKDDQHRESSREFGPRLAAA